MTRNDTNRPSRPRRTLHGASVFTLIIAAGAGLGCAAQAAEATAKAQPGAEVEEVVVHARLRNETLTQAPVVVTAVTGQGLTQAGVTDMTSLENLVPNIKIANGFLLDTFNIRGIGTANANSGFEQQVGLFIDGAYYGNGHWVNGAYVDLEDVEVDEGPQGVHLGKNTIAGAVLINTKNPGNQFEGYVKGGYEFYAAERYVEAAMGGPITDTFGARLVFRASKMDGWAHNFVTHAAEPGSRDDYGRLTLAWKPKDNFDVNVKLSYDSASSNGPGSLTQLLDCGGPGNTPGPFSAPEPQGFFGGYGSCVRDFTTSNADLLPAGGGLTQKTAFTYVPAYTMTTNIHWRQSFGELTSTTAWNKYSLKSWGTSGNTTYADGTGAIPGLNNNANETWSEELRYQTKFDFPINFLAGLWYQHTDFKVYEDFGLVSVPLNSLSPPFGPFTTQVWDTNRDSIDQPGESKAAFAEIQWKPIKTLEIDVGARASLEKKKWTHTQLFDSPFGQYVVGITPAGSVLSGSNTTHNISPSVTVSWRPNDDFTAYGSFKTGFLAGGFSTTGLVLASQDKNTSQFSFGPEKVIGGEGGVKFYLDDRKAQINIATYYYQYTGLQLNTFDPHTISFFVQNAGKVIDKGVEISGRWKVGGGFTLSGEFTYNDAYYAQFIGACLAGVTDPKICVPVIPQPPGQVQNPPAGQNFAGTETDNAPKWSGRIAAQYTREFANDWVLHAGAGLDFTDKYLVAQFPIQPGYVKVDAQLSIDHGPWTAAVIGLNLTNEEICTEAAGRPLGLIGTERQCVIDRSRQVKVEATYRF